MSIHTAPGREESFSSTGDCDDALLFLLVPFVWRLKAPGNVAIMRGGDLAETLIQH